MSFYVLYKFYQTFGGKKAMKTTEQIKEAKEQIEKKRGEIQYITEGFRIKELVADFREDIFYVPQEEYQRNFVWKDNPHLKHRLIESLLLGLPIPVMFFAEIESDDEKKIYEIVDGAQRMQTLESFYDKTEGFALEGLDELDKLNGFRYHELPPRFREKLDHTFMRVVILDVKTTAESKQELFYRINTNAKKLTPTETLRGKYPEVFSFLKNLSQNKVFQVICPIPSSKTLRYEREDLILRFFSFMHKLDDYENQPAPFFKNFCEQMDKEFKSNQSEKRKDHYRKLFEDMVEFVDRYFDDGFKKSSRAKSTPRVRYESIAVGVGLALKEKPDLRPNREDIRAWLKFPEFKKHTTAHAANNKSRVRGRIEFVKNNLLNG